MTYTNLKGDVFREGEAVIVHGSTAIITRMDLWSADIRYGANGYQTTLRDYAREHLTKMTTIGKNNVVIKVGDRVKRESWGHYYTVCCINSDGSMVLNKDAQPFENVSAEGARLFSVEPKKAIQGCGCGGGKSEPYIGPELVTPAIPKDYYTNAHGTFRVGDRVIYPDTPKLILTIVKIEGQNVHYEREGQTVSLLSHAPYRFLPAPPPVARLADGTPIKVGDVVTREHWSGVDRRCTVKSIEGQMVHIVNLNGAQGSYSTESAKFILASLARLKVTRTITLEGTEKDVRAYIAQNHAHALRFPQLLKIEAGASSVVKGITRIVTDYNEEQV